MPEAAGWKLYAIYSTVCWEVCDTEEETSATIARLKRWVSARPNSVTPRIALADAYRAYAWNARGTGYADAVDPSAWKLFDERTSLAEDAMNEADKLDEKCPQWFLVMQKTARDQGRTAEHIAEIVERATAFEPLYYYNYQEYIYTLQPKWIGNEGDSELYAKQIADRIGGKPGDAVYFEIATSLFNCKSCGEAEAILSRVSWPRIQRGYAADEELYGTGNHKLNQFAYLAVRASDHRVAAKVFERIGDNWDQDTWQTRDYFDAMRHWADGQ